MIISLTGFMGCGKSSVGRKLSTLLSCSYVDLDSYIEETAGRTVPEIFASNGEAVFRKMELEALKILVPSEMRQSAPLAPSQLTLGPSPYPGVGKCQFRTNASSQIITSNTPTTSKEEELIILSLGGGTVMTKECAEIVNEKTVCIYLRASVDTLVSHLENESEGRPMLAGGDIRSRVTELMNLRASTYENTAHIIIDTDGKSVEDICIEIDSRLKTL